jgi:hypothetical protein
MPGSWSDFLKLRSGPAPPPSSEAGAVRVYADSDGALRSVQSDGTDAAIGGGSSLPDTAGHDEGDLLALDAGLDAIWTPPAAAGLPLVVVWDNTGGTIFPGSSANRDPTPVTVYTVVRDDLGAAADPTNYPKLPAGYYLGGGYIDWVPDGSALTPTGDIAARVETTNPFPVYPEGDLGYANTVPITSLLNKIEAPTIMFATTGPTTPFEMLLAWNSSDPITWVRWVFWAAQLVAT